MPKCKDCGGDEVISVSGKPTRTPGFHPDYECKSCGFRWIDRDSITTSWGRKSIMRDLHEALIEVRMGTSDTLTEESAPKRAGYR